MINNINRREFIKLVGIGLASLGVPRLGHSPAAAAVEGKLQPIFLPLVLNNDNQIRMPGRVVHVHAPAVTNWGFNANEYYGSTKTAEKTGVDQALVNSMVDVGVTSLLGLPVNAVAQAWKLLLPGYVHGSRVALKINLNNSGNCSSSTTAIDAIAQPINAVVSGLIQAGVRAQDICVYDAIRYFPDRLYEQLVFKTVNIHDMGCRGTVTTWLSSDPTSIIKFAPPDGEPPLVKLCDTLINADYLINMPILKAHSWSGVTLGFKNHFGSTNNPGGMHAHISTSYVDINTYNGLVDLFSNPHIRNKTCITIGDAIYGSRGDLASPPQPWTTFQNRSPCSLFFATDPVAVDCVMHDLLKAERGIFQSGNSNVYLKLAGDRGLGIFEQGDPWKMPYSSGYSLIDYRRIQL